MVKDSLERIRAILGSNCVETDSSQLAEKYVTPHVGANAQTPLASILPRETGQVARFLKGIQELPRLNVVITSSTTNPKFLGDTVPGRDTVVLDLSQMTQIPFINRRNKVCVVEPGVTWSALAMALKDYGLRPRAPFLPRLGKSALASALDREPPLCPKAQFDISDPLLCLEVVFGNGETFRTGEAAGPLSLEENRRAGAALTNPLGPAQMDIFRVIQGSKGTYGCATWASIQCDLIPKKRAIRFLPHTDFAPLGEFVYQAVRRRIVDEVFILNRTLFRAAFQCQETDLTLADFILVFAINGYDHLPDEKLAYQLEDVNEIIAQVNLHAEEQVDGISAENVIPVLDGEAVSPHPKFTDTTIAVDAFYYTTLDRVPAHLRAVTEILDRHHFPLVRANFYVQPVIQARAALVEWSLMADRPTSPSRKSETPTTYEGVQKIAREVAEFAVNNGGFLSRTYKLVNDLAFRGRDAHVKSLKLLKGIFDPKGLLNQGALVF